MSKRSPQLLLEDIIESANKILAYTDGLSFEQFLADGKTVDAVIRNFEMVHDYMGIDYKIVWLIKEHFLQQMIAEIKNILPPSD